MSGKIICLQTEKEKRGNSSDIFTETLNELLSRSAETRQQLPDTNQSIVEISTNSQLKTYFEGLLHDHLSKKQIFEKEYFLCVSYIADLLVAMKEKEIESVYATDYMIKSEEEDNPQILKEGADMCFYLCSLFPNRCNRRAMKTQDYVDFGTSMYYTFYTKKKSEIAYYMSYLFEFFTEATSSCVGAGMK